MVDESELIDRGLRLAHTWTSGGVAARHYGWTFTDVLLEFLDEAHADGFQYV